MNDLVGAYTRLNEIFRLYVESAFPFRYRALDEERRRLLARENILSQPPLVEPMPVYPSSGKNLHDAALELGTEYEGFPNLASGLLPANESLYLHQWQALQAVVKNRKDIVVTTGTGSGKTECFLLPLIADFAKTSTKWEPISAIDPQRKWWKNGSRDWKPQWSHSKRPHAVRALILYPLNALVEDQLKRLRMTFDSPEAHKWLDDNRKGNRILFGRYTSKTPIPGKDDIEKINVNKLKKELKLLDGTWNGIEKAIHDGNIESDIRYYFQWIEGGEMWSRWDVHYTPPDILITNYSMLNIMLMRQIEEPIFEKTRKWLESDKDNIFYLVIDELHSYRGTPGTEVAYILRLLINRIGLSMDSPQLRILATSASLEQGDKSNKFLKEFFGRNDRFEIISGEQIPPEKGAYKNLHQHAENFSNFAISIQHEPLSTLQPPKTDTEKVKNAISELSKSIGRPVHNNENPEWALADGLQSINAFDALRDACFEINQSVRATSVVDLDKKIFHGYTPSNNSLTTDAMRGFLIALAISRNKKLTAPQPVRAHMLFHNMENLWACTNPHCNNVAVDQKLRIQYHQHALPIGALHAKHCLTCSCGARVLDLIICDVCGEIFFGGFIKEFKVRKQEFRIMTSDQPNLEMMPDRIKMERHYKDYAIFWPTSDKAKDEEYKSTKFGGDRISQKFTWKSAYLDIYTGILSKNREKESEIEGSIFHISKPTDKNIAFPPKCPRCDTDFSKRTRIMSPLRQHRTGFQKANQVIAGALARELPEEKFRKLVIFSDSRQNAAKLSAGMELDHYRDMVRICLLGAHENFQNMFYAVVKRYAKSNESIDKIAEINPKLAEELKKDQSTPDKHLHQQFKDLSEECNSIFYNIRDVEDGDGEGEYKDITKSLIWGYPYKVPLRHIRNIVFDRLLDLGICPGGIKKEMLEFKDDTIRKEWWECYDWSSGKPQKIEVQTHSHIQHIIDMKNSLMNELVKCLFPHVTRTFENLGLGYVTYYSVKDEANAKLLQACQAIIRNLCERKKYYHSEFFYPASKGEESEFKKDIIKYLCNVGLEPIEIKQSLKQASVWMNGENEPGVNPDFLWLKVHLYTYNEEYAKGWICTDCKSFSMHQSGGYCINCNKQLTEEQPCPSLDYYRYLSKDAGNGFRFHCEELTGQTDDGDRPERQRWFQEIFLPEESEIPKIHGVDLLSVTTTMEAGVDIGSLLSVMMANMPPRRFNYQQRVGRAGRRGAGLSFAVTLCRGKSHDEFYYNRPEMITGDPPPPPYVDTRQISIMRRVLAKEILRRAFCRNNRNQVTNDSVHGEFGPVAGWFSIRPDIESFIVSTEGLSAIEEIMDYLTAGTSWQEESERYNQFINAQGNYIQNELLKEIDGIIEDKLFNQTDLSERMANAGLLPMFGFPTRVRNLYTKEPSLHYWKPGKDTVDRPLDIAVSQFAPGSETVKDKKVYTSAGVIDFIPPHTIKHGFMPPLTESNQRIGICEKCQALIYLEEENEPPVGGEKPSKIECKVCKEVEVLPLDAREPRGFFCSQEPETYDGNFEWTPRSTRPMIFVDTDNFSKLESSNLSIFADEKDVIAVNDNSGECGFDFHEVKTKNMGGAYAVNPYFRFELTSPSYRIALLSRRHTDVLITKIDKWPEGVYADLTTVTGRAAWYSFAFLLRSCAVAILDIDTQELEAGIRVLLQDDKAVGQAFMCDNLENGAGYCRWLALPGNFHKLLDSACNLEKGTVAGQWILKEHRDRCDTSCNDCLREYYNMPYHGLLDWKLALDMAQIASSQDYCPDITNDWHQGIENPWMSIVKTENSPIQKTLSQLGYKSMPNATLPSFILQNKKRKKILIATHPLWTVEYPQYKKLYEDYHNEYPDFEIEKMDLYLALRRVSDCI